LPLNLSFLVCIKSWTLDLIMYDLIYSIYIENMQRSSRTIRTSKAAKAEGTTVLKYLTWNHYRYYYHQDGPIIRCTFPPRAINEWSRIAVYDYNNDINVTTIYYFMCIIREHHNNNMNLTNSTRNNIIRHNSIVIYSVAHNFNETNNKMTCIIVIDTLLLSTVKLRNGR